MLIVVADGLIELLTSPNSRVWATVVLIMDLLYLLRLHCGLASRIVRKKLAKLWFQTVRTMKTCGRVLTHSKMSVH